MWAPLGARRGCATQPSRIIAGQVPAILESQLDTTRLCCVANTTKLNNSRPGTLESDQGTCLQQTESNCVAGMLVALLKAKTLVPLGAMTHQVEAPRSPRASIRSPASKARTRDLFGAVTTSQKREAVQRRARV